MMKIIVGLGNPGKEYERTRHNAGFAFVERMNRQEVFRNESKFEAEISKVGNVLFVKPTTFMNDSGRSVRKIMDFYKLTISDLILVHDDLDLKLGEYKIQLGVGPKVHNGVASVEQHMGNKNFLRLRLGIDSREGARSMSGADYVLAKFSDEEQQEMNDIFDEAADELLAALED